MSTSIFYDPPIRAKRVYAGEVRVVDDIKFWDKATKVVNSRIHGDDGNLNIVVENSNKEVNFFTDQITFHDHDGTQLGYIDSSGTIHGLSVDGHATEVDISGLEDDISSNALRVNTLEGNVETLESNILTLHGNIENIESNISILHGNIENIESNISILHGNIVNIQSNISILHGNIENIESNISILHGNVETI